MWGCICAASLDDVAVVGGDGQFVSALLERVGGEVVLRERFLRFARDEWSVGEDMRRRLLRMAGWE